MLIEFPRGDSYEQGFVLKNKSSASPVEEAFDEVYFTVKKLWSNRDYKIQKRLSTGGITYDGEGHYTLRIAPEDTNDLGFGEYDFDIEFVKGSYKKTFCGKFILSKEVTHQSNE